MTLEIKSISINGKEVKRIVVNGGEFFSKVKADYYLVDYIESTGNCKIITSAPLGNNARVTFENLCLTRNNVSLFSTTRNPHPGKGGFGCNPDTTFYYMRGNVGGWINSSVGFLLKTYMDVSFGSSIKLNGKTMFTTTITTEFAANYNLCIFSDAYDGNAGIRIGHTLQYDNEVIVHDMYPCLRAADNALGLYDVITNTFFENTGTGTLIYGNILGEFIPPLPIKQYNELEYIESSGTLYIDTGIIAADDVGIYCDFILLLAGDNIVMGARAAQESRLWINPYIKSICPSWNSLYSTGVEYLDIRRLVSMNYLNDRSRYIDGEKYLDITEPFNGGAELSITLFCGNRYNSGVSLSSKVKIYRAKVTKGNEIVRDLIPVLRNVDNEVCMYDLITNTYFTNLGRGAFIPGPVKEDLE